MQDALGGVQEGPFAERVCGRILLTALYTVVSCLTNTLTSSHVGAQFLSPPSGCLGGAKVDGR